MSPNVQVIWKKLEAVGPLELDIQGTPINFLKTNELLIISLVGYSSSINIHTKRIGLSFKSGILLLENEFGYTP